MIRNDKKFVTKDISKQIGSARLSFAPTEFMEKYLNISPGSVSVMGLFNDINNDVQFLIDRDIIMGEYVGCHPCINTSSLKIKTCDLIEKIVPKTNHNIIYVNL